MTAQVRDILQSFDMLPEIDRRELATEIIKRSLAMKEPPLTDEQLVVATEEVFLELDRSEAGHA